MTATLAQACLEGNLGLVTQILEASTADIDTRDESGTTPLQHAVKGNHVEIASRLLAKGASAVQVAEQDLAKDNPELSQLILTTLKHTQSAVFQAAPVVDSHGGKQMPDGSVSYVQPPAGQQSEDVSTQLQQQQTLASEPQQPLSDPTQNPEQQQRSNSTKDAASGTLPPPEVACLIPCRFFPNCRYGDKCIFAHPMPLPNGSPSSQGPVSPGQSHMYYQAPSYGYPAYGPPQHFYSMAPPMPIQYSHSGVPMPIHMPPHPQQMGSENLGAGQSDAYHSSFAAQPQHHQFMPNGAHFDQGVDAPTVDSPSAPADTSESAAEVKPEGSQVDANEPAQNDRSADKAASPQQQQLNPQQQQHQQQQQHHQQQQHQPTSFSAFMTHHAVPFHPGQLPFSGAPMGIDGAIISGSQAFPRGNKGPRRGGPALGGFGHRSDYNGTSNSNGTNSSSKRSSERPACLFFARSACKHGEECRFPHILPDGTDARGPNAGRSSQSIEASRGINRALAAKNARTSNGSANGTSQQTQDNNNASNNVIPSTSQASAHTSIESVVEADSSLSEASAPAVSSTEDARAPEKVQESVPDTSSASVAATIDSEANSSNAKSVSVESSAAKRVPGSSSRDDVKTGATANGTSERAPAPIPSKPILNGQPPSQPNGKSHTGAKTQANGVAKGQTQNGARSGANGRSNTGNTNRANGNSAAGFQLPRKLNSQRLPHPDDFPALSNGASLASGPAVANGAPKVNFSAILSAPAPPKKQTEIKEDSSTANQQDDKPNGDNSVTADAETRSSPKPSKPTSVPDFASIVSKPVAV